MDTRALHRTLVHRLLLLSVVVLALAYLVVR